MSKTIISSVTLLKKLENSEWLFLYPIRGVVEEGCWGPESEVLDIIAGSFGAEVITIREASGLWMFIFPDTKDLNRLRPIYRVINELDGESVLELMILDEKLTEVEEGSEEEEDIIAPQIEVHNPDPDYTSEEESSITQAIINGNN